MFITVKQFIARQVAKTVGECYQSYQEGFEIGVQRAKLHQLKKQSKQQEEVVVEPS